MEKMSLKSWVYKTVASLALVGMALVSVNDVRAVAFTYSSEVGSFISFPGNSTFSFTPAVNNFSVTSGTAAGRLGEITGTFTIGTITTVGPVSQAPVTGTGGFTIHDGFGFDFTSTLTWVSITQVGTADGLNKSAQVNLNNFAYGGVNPDLVALRNAVAGYNVLTFPFIPAVTLTDLKSGAGAHSTSFSGMVVPDGGTTVALLGFALVGVAILRRTMKTA